MGKAKLYGMKTACIPNSKADALRKRKRKIGGVNPAKGIVFPTLPVGYEGGFNPRKPKKGAKK